MDKSVQNAKSTETCEETSKFYLDLIKDIKTGRIAPSSVVLSQHTPTLTIEEILENMEEINSKICEFLLIPRVPIAQHLEYFLGKGKSFDDHKYERLFDISTKNAGSKDAKIGSKLLDYSIKDKLVGFYARSSGPQWNNEKISDFIQSVKQSNENL